MLFIGPMDISQSLGHPGDPAHPEVQQVVRQVIDTCNANKKPFGIFVGTTEAARKYRDLGASYIAIASDLAFMARITFWAAERRFPGCWRCSRT